MKTLIHIGGLFPDRIGKDVYDHLERLYPEGKGKHIYGAHGLPAEDTRVKTLVEYLTSVGWAGEMKFERVYDSVDYEQAQFFRIWPEQDFGSVSERSPSGELMLHMRHLQGKDLGHDGRIAGMAVSYRIKLLMEQVPMKRVKYRNTILVADTRRPSLSTAQEPFWEVYSDLILPPMSPASEQGFVWGPEYHYQEHEFQSVGSFDLAQAHEYLGGDMTLGLGRNWVASKLFCDFCCAEELPIVWKPVRID